MLLCSVIFLPGALASDTQMAKGEVEGFALEIPDETGQTQTILEGSKAVFNPAGTIDITEVKAKIHPKDKSSIVVVSSRAEYHRNTKVVTTDSPVKIDSKDMHVTGTGLVWEPDKESIWIREGVRVVLKNIQKE